MPGVRGGDPKGRWPANLVLTHAASCRVVGERSIPTGTAVKRNLSDDGADQQIDVKARAQRGVDESYGDPDGLEVVPAYECAPDCPVGALDRQSGTLTSGTPGTMRLGENTAVTGSGHRRAGGA